MTMNEIHCYLRDNPNTMCWLSFGTGQIRLGKGEGIVLLRCMKANAHRPHSNYTGPTKVIAEATHNGKPNSILFE